MSVPVKRTPVVVGNIDSNNENSYAMTVMRAATKGRRSLPRNTLGWRRIYNDFRWMLKIIVNIVVVVYGVVVVHGAVVVQIVVFVGIVLEIGIAV